MLPQSADDIKNLALLAISQRKLASFNDTDNPSAITCNEFYDQCRQELLRSHLWNFARKRAAISLDPTATPLFDYMGAYLLPDDWLKLHHVGTEYDLWDPPHHDIQGRHVLYGFSTDFNTAPETIYIEYTQDFEDVTKMDALFIKAFRLYLASEICVPITGNNKVQEALEKRYLRALIEATAINHQERPLRTVERDPIYEARMNVEDSGLDDNIRVPRSAWPS